jgi:hypothetical protein
MTASNTVSRPRKPTAIYHPAVWAETAMFRLKTLFGDYLNNHRFDTQAPQAYARLAAMNVMTRLGGHARYRRDWLNPNSSSTSSLRFMQ